MTKIVTIVRTRNEERNIARFCKDYKFVDKILVADGGSTDNTIEIARDFPNVEVRNYTERVYGDNGIWRNPEGKHIQYLIEWAKEEKCDWMIFEDCDSFPTRALQELGRRAFSNAEEAGEVCIKIPRVYLYGKDKWFPKSYRQHKLHWAWKPESNIHAQEDLDWGIIMHNVPPVGYSLNAPFATLHDFCPTEEITQQKLDFYNNSGKMDYIKSIPELFGELEDRLPWMYD